MKKWFVPVCLIYASTLFAGDDWSMNNHWNFYGDYAWVSRKSQMLHNKTLVRKTEKGITTPVLKSGHLLNHFDGENGFRAGGVYMQRTWSIEGCYLYSNQWMGESYVHGHENLSYPFKKHEDPEIVRAFLRRDHAHAEYTSQFWTADLNYWRHVTPRRMDYFSFSWIAGTRYVQLNETTKDVFQKKSGKRSEYKIATKNGMFGPQTGVNIQVNPYRQWSWDFTGKIGGLLDQEEQKMSIRNKWNKFRGGQSHDMGIALFVDLYATLTWHFFRHANLHIGYEVFYMSGLALAAERYKRTTSEHALVTVKAIGEACIYDAFGGLTIAF